MTVRRDIVFEQWRALAKKPLISINELDDLLCAVEKLLMNYDQTVESRDNWKRKFKELQKNGR